VHPGRGASCPRGARRAVPGGGRLSLAAFVFLVIALIALVPRTAHAQAPAPPPFVDKTATFVWDPAVLKMTLAYRDILDAEIEKKLSSGITTVIVMYAGVYEDGSTSVVAASAKKCSVKFDVWEEVYVVKITQPGGERTELSPNIKGVLRRCVEAQELPLVDRTLLKVDGKYRVQGFVQVNPISKEIHERIKAWVSRPSGQTNVGAGDALFGSFVGLFVARIGNADREIRFRTQVFVVPPIPPPPPP
jgi:hypothetical protein